jgi:hypothetical protein
MGGKTGMLSQKDRFIIVLMHEFVDQEVIRMGLPESGEGDRSELYRLVSDFVWTNWGGFQKRMAREGKGLMQVFKEEWSAFLTRQ